MSQVVGAVLASVAERIKGSNQIVKDRVIEALVEKEVAKRADTFDKALSKFTELKRQFDNTRPDQVSINHEGVKVESYSKAKWDERIKTEQRLERLSQALEAAMTEGSFGKLTEVLQKLGNDKSEQAE